MESTSSVFDPVLDAWSCVPATRRPSYLAIKPAGRELADTDFKLEFSLTGPP